jgi:PAS domain S-box-containing protein
MILALLALEFFLLTAAALLLHVVSRRYGLVPLMVYLAGLVAILQGLGADALVVEAWTGQRFVATDVTLVPTILLVFLLLYDTAGAAVARTALAGLVGVSFMAFTVHAAHLAHLRLAGGTMAADATEDLRMVAASIAAFLVGVTALIGGYQGARNRLRRLPIWAVQTLALLCAAAADTMTFRFLALPAPVALAGLGPALAIKSTAALLVAPAAAWYLARVAPRFPDYVGPEDREALDVLFGQYGRQEVELRTARGAVRQTEARLRETDRRFRHTFELAAVGIAHVTPDGTILLANPGIASLLGCTAEELEGRNLSSFLPEHTGARPEGGAFLPSGEIRFLRKDGTALWGLSHTTEVRDEAGRASYHIVVVEDITGRKAAEDRLRRVERLEAVGRLTGGVAHDFNNLLAVIIGDAEEAMSTASEKDVADALTSVMTAARKGAKLTHQLLAYSGQQVLDPEPLDCADLIHGMSELLRLTVGGGVDVEIHADQGLTVDADRTHLESVLLSLAANARDAMPRGGRLTVRAYPEDAVAPAEPAEAGGRHARYAVIEVEDTGLGMTPEVSAQAFEPFFTTKPVGQGSGLGLSMVFGFARQSGGRTDIESEPGRGTRVRLHLPTPGPPPPRGRAARDATQGTAEMVLVVEDDRDVARVLTHQLARIGYRVSSASDASEALTVVAGVRPDLVVADVVLPGDMSGVHLAEEIQRRCPGVPVLFVSGHSVEFLRASHHLPRDAELLMKPFESADLARRVRALLDGVSGP